MLNTSTEAVSIQFILYRTPVPTDSFTMYFYLNDINAYQSDVVHVIDSASADLNSRYVWI